MIDLLTRLLSKNAGAHGPLMLMYHSIASGGGTPPWRWAVSRPRFREQLDFLGGGGWSTLTMRELQGMPAEHNRSVVITFDDGYYDNLLACEELERRGMRATWFMVSGSLGVEPRWPEDGRPSGRLLKASELRALRAAGMEVGSHTVTHARLPPLDDDALRTELEHSKATLEEAIGDEVSSFAYPYGAWDERCEAAVRAAGYARACTTRTGWALHDGNPLRLRRLTVFNDDTVATLARKLALASHEVDWPSLAAYWGRRLAARLGVRA